MDRISTYEIKVEAEDEYNAIGKAKELVPTHKPYDVTWQYSAICVGK